MKKRAVCLLGMLLFASASAWAQKKPVSTPAHPLVVEHGIYKVHLLLHDIGSEEYTVTESGGHQILTAQVSFSDRGTKRGSSTTLEMDESFNPIRIVQHPVPEVAGGDSVAELTASSVQVREADASRTIARPRVAFVGFGAVPASVQMMMMRYWRRHGRPASLPLLRANARALPVEIRSVGYDAFDFHGHILRLERYTVANLVFGREILWMNDSGRIAAMMTFAGGLPQELVLDEYSSVAGQMVHSAVQQEMLDLAALDRQVSPTAQGSYAIAGARLIDGTGAPAVENATVLVRDGRIAAAGAGVSVPAGTRIVHAEGQSLLPGLWEMHSHYSGVEFGPALLAAGVTTARDCGGEVEFLTAVRREIDQKHALGPRLLLAGLIDAGGLLGFGVVDANTPEEGVAAVDAYADAKFEQIKVYTQLRPEVLKAITAEAHRRGLTVTGHVPAAVDAFEGVEDGMDQINHLQFVTKAMQQPGSNGPLDLNSERAKALIALLKQRQIVIDPTVGWGEMAGHPKNIDVASFEPGIHAAPESMAFKFRGLGVPAADEAKFHERMQTNLRVIRALYDAGVPIVAGSDTNIIGYGLDRELELYVQAGMTPLAAIQSATLVPARAMKLDRELGTVEVGKRADLLLVRGNPLAKISDLRQVVSVVKDGRMYDSKALGRSVGFQR
ncbi:amidohydrolase family protein [Granulicella sp. WH15]|uniref:amidohydrolase family protein n=1 Tax=Granulicella sp. WH15 TaxID=2602070 RepID=UPI0013669130|nr:amidohydrolase family protein [Granulicella sp. WH15]QHN05086.1 amidohydrolase family protein [Granulicella sp. WH15]